MTNANIQGGRDCGIAILYLSLSLAGMRASQQHCAIHRANCLIHARSVYGFLRNIDAIVGVSYTATVYVSLDTAVSG